MDKGEKGKIMRQKNNSREYLYGEWIILRLIIMCLKLTVGLCEKRTDHQKIKMK